MTSFERRFLSVGLSGAAQAHEGGMDGMKTHCGRHIERVLRCSPREGSLPAGHGDVRSPADSAQVSSALNRSLRHAGCWLLATSMVLVATPSLRAQSTSQPETISLQDAIALAESANPESDIAKSQERESRAGLKTARSVLLPKLRASETFTDSTDPVFAFSARLRQGRFTANDFSPANLNYPSATTDFTSTVGATWMMFDSGKTLNQIRAARSNVAAAEKQGEATKQDLAYQVIRAYYRALLADQEKITTAAAVARSRSFSKEVHDRVDTGLALASEDLQADVDLSQREQDAAEAESNAYLAYADLGGVLGHPSMAFTLLEPTGTPHAVDSTIEQLQKSATETRPDVAAARSRVIAAAQSVRASHGAYGPSISSFANVEADNPHLTGGGNTSWTVGAKAQIQLFDGGARKAEVSKSNAEREMAEAALRQVETQANLQVMQAFYAVQTAQRQYAISNMMLEKGHETLRTALDRYDAGLATITEVLAQQDQLRTMELNRVESLYRWWTAEAQLRLASGADIIKPTGTHP